MKAEQNYQYVLVFYATKFKEEKINATLSRTRNEPAPQHWYQGYEINLDLIVFL